MNNYPPFYEKIKNSDQEFYKILTDKCDFVMKPGALDIKTKMLILLAVDAYAASSGVKNIAHVAKQMGASKEEIYESLRIAYNVAGNVVIHNSVDAFEE